MTGQTAGKDDPAPGEGRGILARARLRLAETQAAITAMEKTMAMLAGHGLTQAHLAIMEARQQQFALRTYLAGLQQRKSMDLARLQSDLERIWERFEAASTKWSSATGRHLSALEARAEAQMDAWGKAVTDIEADAVVAARKSQLVGTSIVQLFRDHAARQAANLASLKAAGVTNYQIWSEALKRSRSAFDDAWRTTQTPFRSHTS